MEREYVTIESEKRNLGLKGLEVADFVLAISGLVLFIFFIIGLGQIEFAFYFIVVWGFMMLPVNMSNKNRIYKIVWMLIIYALNNHIFLYEKDKKEGALNEYSKKFKELKDSLKSKIDDDK